MENLVTAWGTRYFKKNSGTWIKLLVVNISICFTEPPEMQNGTVYVLYFSIQYEPEFIIGINFYVFCGLNLM
jgi:hypothetical protein